jgi:hypothetical protein
MERIVKLSKQEQDNLLLQLEEEHRAFGLEWQKTIISSLGLSDGVWQDLMVNENAIHQQLRLADVKEGDTLAQVEQKIKSYTEKLNNKKSGSGTKWAEDLSISRQKSEDIRNLTDIDISIKALYGEGKRATERRKKIQEKIKESKSPKYKGYNKLDTAGQLAMELTYANEQAAESALKAAKKENQKGVEEHVYSLVNGVIPKDAEGNNIVTTKKQWLEGKRTKKEIKEREALADRYYNLYAKNIIAGRGSGVSTIKIQKQNAEKIFEEIERINGESLEVIDHSNIDGIIKTIDKLESESQITPEKLEI